ncbi:hypothetical protein PAXRUDRAFT_21567 [Paxillus rubicundulus Ve08.2h10]|uniref:Uncharacterized protein n=1 Tax=Paxillus rubicundulus Ve08.2h10 TaxID=930991 RepID=A0A0D0CZ79_9AGAM|nr:hypothetical protein PAXRUDRAFT_21567 [Paxillus rubicundulus Ve08.2h10]
MQMFPINQVIAQGWPLLQAILKPGPEVSTHILAQVPKSVLKGKGVDPLECGGVKEAGGSKAEGKQALDGNIKGAGYPLKVGPKFWTWPLTSKKAKASVSKSRPKTPSVTQKAKFGIDVGVTPSESIKVYHSLAGPPPQSIPWASALKLVATPVNPLLDP